MRGNRDIFSGKSIYNRETISRQDHRISEYRMQKLCWVLVSERL